MENDMKNTIHALMIKVLQKIINDEVIIFPGSNEVEIEILNTLVFNLSVNTKLENKEIIRILENFLTLDKKIFFKKRINFETFLNLKKAIDKTEILSIQNGFNQNNYIIQLINDNFNKILIEIAESQLED